MAKVLKAILISAYSAVFYQLLRTIFIERNETIIIVEYILKTPAAFKKLYRELKKYPKNVTTINLSFRPPSRLPTDLKYILKYTQAFSHYSSSVYRNGQNAFIDSNCKYINCFLTNDKNLLVDPRYFDAILFDVENTWDVHPSTRSLHQKYIFTASESADNYPVCHPLFDEYYNWTWTYRLDSDIRWTYITIHDTNGTVIGPNINMTWVDPMKPTSKEVKKKIATKTKTAAWFVSNCLAKNNRDNITRGIQTALKKYGMTIDIYGWCGNLTCPRNRLKDCLDILEKDYYFYLAFENSMSEDYVTEKILYPLQHYTVPIVFGGADYSRFLPPNSYINAAEMEPEAVASLMIEAIVNKSQYEQYFQWHNHYEYRETPEVADVCTLCQLLNENRNHSIVRNFRKWWNPEHNYICELEEKGLIETFRQ